MSMQRIAVLGLGTMGGGMATQLVEKGFSVAVWNRDFAKAEALRAAGASVASTPAQASEDADIVLAMLADDDASRSVWLGEAGALAAMKPQAIAIESSTLTLGWVRELATAAQHRGIAFLDAPVTGSKAQAQGGTLRFLVGGDLAALEQARPALEAMGSAIEYLGPSGSASLFKLANNFLCGVQVASLAEALSMLEVKGLDPRQCAQLLSDGAPGSPLVNAVSQRMLDRSYAPTFYLPLMAKDLAYAEAAFAEAGIQSASAAAARERFLAAVKMGFGELDIAAVVEPMRASASRDKDT